MPAPTSAPAPPELQAGAARLYHQPVPPRLWLLPLAYLLGSVHPAHVVARARGVDLRRYGSGTVSATGIFYHVSRWAVVPVGLLDVLKGALPGWLALELGFGLPSAAAAGLAVVVGHNWPVFLGFRGGRGLSPYLGSLLLLFPAGAVWLLVTLGIGKLLRQTARLSLLGMATIPPGAWLLGRPPSVILATLGMLLLTLLKRVEANRRPVSRDPAERRRVLLRRLILDRDVPAGAAWVERRPNGESEARADQGPGGGVP